MFIFDFSEVHETQEIEIRVRGKRRMNISVNSNNIAVQTPYGASKDGLRNITEGSLFFRTRDFDDHDIAE